MPEQISLGFTGTKKGLSTAQKVAFRKFARQFYGKFHNGLCIGADEDSLKIIDELDGYVIYLHPPTNTKYKSDYIPNRDYWEYLPKPYAKRDLRIVRKSDILVATPSGYEEIKRGSGTWLTIRLARAELKPVVIIWPDGTCPSKDLIKMPRRLHAAS